MIREKVYLGHDNSVDLQLLADGKPVFLADVTKMQLVASDGSFVIDSESSGPAFSWGTGNGVVYLSLGMESVQPGFYLCHLLVFDDSNPEGIVWDQLGLTFISI